MSSPRLAERRPSRRTHAALAAAVLLATASVGVGPAPAGARTRTLVGCDQATVRIQVTTDVELDPTCTYTAGLDIRASGVTLDCRGARVDGTGRGGAGILVTVPVDQDLEDVTVTGCQVRGFTNSLRVTRDGFRTLAAGQEHEHGTRDIRVIGNDFAASRGVGVFVDGYVSEVLVEGNRIEGAGSTGVYLEAGSRRSVVRDNVLIDNGFLQSGPGGQTLTVGGSTLWWWGIGREGIAVDGSTDNVIEGNRISGSSAGGIFLYENCGEYAGSSTWFERRTGADRNRIEGNEITDTWVGVWVGSRMGENTLPMECSDPAYVERPGVRVVLDHASGNVIRDNDFHDVDLGVRVEDDATTVERNRFTSPDPAAQAVVVGTPHRTAVLDRPVRGTVLRANRADLGTNDSPYRWVEGEADTTSVNNLALGTPAPFCAAPSIPRGPFIFVIAVAPANPDGSAPPTPDLTRPTLGPLPSCRSTDVTTTTAAAAPSAPLPSPARPLPGRATYAG